jgi:hypothetical protein
MLVVVSAWLACLALFLELAERAPTLEFLAHHEPDCVRP